MPGLMAADADRERYCMDYVNTCIERDVKIPAQAGELTELHDIPVAAGTGQQLGYSETADGIGVSAPTAKARIPIPERSGIVFILYPYAINAARRPVKTPKTYFMGAGPAAYLSRWPDAPTPENEPTDGAFHETCAATENAKSYRNAGKPAGLYYLQGY